MVNRETERFLKKLGQRLAAQRRAKMLTQEQLAAKTDLSRNTIALIEAGQRGTTTPTLNKLVKGISTSFEDLFRGM